MPSDSVSMQSWKIQRRVPGRSCEFRQTFNASCYQTIAFVDEFGSWFEGMRGVLPQGQCGYSSTYLDYTEKVDMTKMYLIVKDNEVRATFESSVSRRLVTVMNFNLAKYGYKGGRVGIFT